MNPDLSYDSNSTDESKLVIELFKNCDEGQALNLKKDLENCFSAPKLDTATRRCVKKATTNRRTYAECVNLLLVCIDVNYRNPNFENSTLFMFACEEGNYFIIEQICNFDYSQNHLKPDEKINLNLKDNNNRNFLHYLLTSQIQEDDAYEIVSRFVNDCDYKTRYINREENSVFYTHLNPVNFSHQKKFNFEINVKEVFNTADILGNTPIYYYSKIIENFEEFCHNSTYFNIFSDKSIISPDKIFEKFISEDYNETLFLLGQLNTIKCINEYPNLSLEWNIILTKLFCNIEKESNENKRKDSFRISPESILSKFLDTNREKNFNKKFEKKKLFTNNIRIFQCNKSKKYPCQYLL